MADDKSEKPTHQRLKKSREEGQFLSARSMISAVEFTVALLMISHFFGFWSGKMQSLTVMLLQLGGSGDMGDAQWIQILRVLLIQTLWPILAFGVVLFAVTGAANLGVTQFGFSFSRLMPNFNKLNPISKLKDLPSQNLKSVVEAVCLIALLALSINGFYQDHAAALLRLPFQSLPTATSAIGEMLTSVLWKAAALFFVFGAVDLARSYKKHMSGLKMTKQEVKQENKSNEGNPEVKGKIRRLRRAMLQNKMMQDVPTATAVVVNPTHYAVAIKYDVETMSSPIVVAKGKNKIALKIRTLAVQNQVPIIENPPLARALHAAIKVGQPIPPEFYRAMAEILAYIYKLMGHKLP